MKASDIIAQLQAMIETWGDREVKFSCPSYYAPGNQYYFSAESFTEIRYICLGDLEYSANYFEIS